MLDSLRCIKLTSRNKAKSILLDRRKAVNRSYRHILPQMPFFSDKWNQYPSFNSKYFKRPDLTMSHAMVLAPAK